MAIIRCVTDTEVEPKLNMDEGINELFCLTDIYKEFENKKLGTILLDEMHDILAGVSVVDVKRNLISKWELFQYIDTKYRNDYTNMVEYMKGFFKDVPIIKDFDIVNIYKKTLLYGDVLFYLYADSKTTNQIFAIFGCKSKETENGDKEYEFEGMLPDKSRRYSYKVGINDIGKTYFLTYEDAQKEKEKREELNKTCYAVIFNAWLADVKSKKEVDGLLCVHGGLSGGPGYLGFGSCDRHTNVHYGGAHCPKNCPDFELISEQNLWNYFCREYSQYPAYFNAKYGKKED